MSYFLLSTASRARSGPLTTTARELLKSLRPLGQNKAVTARGLSVAIRASLNVAAFGNFRSLSRVDL